MGGGRLDPTLSLEVAIENRSDAPFEAILGVEWNLTMLGGGGNPSAWYEVDGTRTGHDGAGTATGLTTIGQGNDFLGVALTTTVDEPADAWWSAIDTVSNSENGFERIYQGSALLLSWPVRLEPGARREVQVGHVVAVARDRATGGMAAAVPVAGT
jgi:hypothetical protein